MTHSKFISWFHNEFVNDPLFTAMENISENSPYHRERTVGVHTHMVVSEYLTRCSQGWVACPSTSQMSGAFACAFHDVGKPPARKPHHSPERGTYYSYAGHELVSARLWEDWAVRNWTMLRDEFDFCVRDLYHITWAIEHHRPWGLVNKDKVQRLWTTAHNTIGTGVYKNILLADTYGRIADNQTQSRQKVNDWIRPSDVVPLDYSTGIKPKLIMLIGASGSGKSTYATYKNYHHYSWDELRLRWYGSDYHSAFEASKNDVQFMNKVNKEYIKCLDGVNGVVVDNTNLSAKRRRFFIDQARARGYQICAVTFPTSMSVVVDRQTTRSDKTVPSSAVLSQYMSTQQPQYGEFDIVTICDTNL